MKRHQIVITLILALALPLRAYIDPGTGSMLLAVIIGIVSTLFFLGKELFVKLRHLPNRIFNREKEKPSRETIVLFSEGKQYWPVFKPVLEEFSRRGIEVSYLAAQADDPGFEVDLPLVKTRLIGEGGKGWFALGLLEAEILVATTPGLDVFQFKRSKGVKHYAHLAHSAGGLSGYRIYGIDYYDSVLTGGFGDKEMIEEIEEARGLPRKRIIPVGCTYLDVFREDLKQKPEVEFFTGESKRPVILISPTWGDASLLAQNGREILAQLCETDRYRIIFRPHPQSLISDKEILEKLQVEFPEGENLIWDFSPKGLPALRVADLMISDFSGIVFDYLFLFKKPVLCFTEQYSTAGKDAMDLEGKPWNVKALEELEAALDTESVGQIASLVEERLARQVSIEKQIEEIQPGMDQYPGESGRRACDAILEILEEIQNQ